MSLQNLGKVSSAFRTILGESVDGDNVFKILGEVIGNTIDNNDFAKALKNMGATADDIRSALSGKGIKPEVVNDIMDTLADSSTFIDKLKDSFTGINKTLKNTGKGIGDSLKNIGASLLSFATSPAGIGTIALLTTIGIGLAALKTQYEYSFDGLSEKLEESRSKTDEVASSVESLTSQIESNRNKIKQLESDGLTPEISSELKTLEQQNSLLEAQLATKQALLKIRQKETAKIAGDAFNAQYDSVRTGWSDPVYDVNTGQIIVNESYEGRTITESYKADVEELKKLICNDLCQEGKCSKQRSPRHLFVQKASGKSPGISSRHWPL